MKKLRKVVSLLLVVLMLGSICVPSIPAEASSKVSIVYNGTTKSYSKKKTSIVVNGKKISLSNVPAYLNSASYVGPAYEIFKKSTLGVKYTDGGKKLTITYKNRTLKMTSGSKKVTVNGKSRTLQSVAPIKATYMSSGKERWIVPIHSVCDCLGITYSSSSGTIKLTGSTTGTATSSTTTTTKVISSTSNSGKIVICMDAGHGGSDSGATNKKLGKAEKNMTLAIVKAAKKYFDKDSRFKVYYTRTSDSYPSLNARCSLANNVKADLFICVHIDSAGATSTGTETLYNNLRSSSTKKNGITSYQLATAMQKVAQKSTGFRNRGLVKRHDLRVLNKTNMPACLIEYGFISNPKECATMNANLSRYGKDLYYGIVSFMKSKGKI